MIRRLALLAQLLMARAAADIPLEFPQPVDSRLLVSLYADAPEIVTPIGAAVDARGRLFVLESHTHLAPSNYGGPKRDRIIVFEGERTEAQRPRRTVFADDVLEGMNVAFTADGTLYVVTAKTVVALPDANRDGRADEQRVVVRLETEQRYPHNQLLGLTVSPDGWLYVARGNTGGDVHAWVGADGRRLEGYGNGGDIVRCRPDGSGVERVATGFWNPFDLNFDRHGRLLCVDNDPDSRGPNRLLHIIRGGDYGFKSLYGASGLHPYDAWDGELPGTLPMIAGIGESPSGVLDLSFTALPTGYRDTIAVTIWGEHNVSLVRPTPAGISLRGRAEPFIRGGKWFRPVALAAAPDGTLYITDWVLKDYPNHGHGRIWKVSTRPGITRSKPVDSFSAPIPDGGSKRLAALVDAKPADYAELQTAVRDADPFVCSAAIDALARPEMRDAVKRDLENTDNAVRLGALLALRRANVDDADRIIRARLRDPDEQVRLMALIWAGEKELRALKSEIDAAVSVGDVTPRLFETWLATVQILDPPPPPAGAKRIGGFRIRRDLDFKLLTRVATDEKRPAAMRAFALRRLGERTSAIPEETLLDLARSGDTALRIEAVRTLAADAASGTLRLFHEIAANRNEPAQVRAEAIVALGAGARTELTPLLGDSDPIVRTQAARTLRVPLPNAMPPPPANATDAWMKLLARSGDAAAGERVFFAPTSMCAQCHRVAGRGGTLGPDLSLIARTANREQLVRSIVEPSGEIAPQFQGWEVKTKSGDVLTGLQGHWRTGGSASLVLLDGREKNIPGDQVVSFRAMESSLMPDGLAALFSVEEFRDLIDYLERLK